MINIYYYTGPHENDAKSTMYMYYDTVDSFGKSVKGVAHKPMGFFKDLSKFPTEFIKSMLEPAYLTEKTCSTCLLSLVIEKLKGKSVDVDEIKIDTIEIPNKGYLFTEENKEKWECKNIVAQSGVFNHKIVFI